MPTVPMKKKVTWKSHYGIAADITLVHEVDDLGMLWLSNAQAKKVRKQLGESNDYYDGLTLPYKGEGCWVTQ